jgi:hypothetical protein
MALFRARAARGDFAGRLMMFGRPSLLWDEAPSAEELFAEAGSTVVHSMDVSPYQGATHIHDLNDPNPPEELQGQYDQVICDGTLEHVFHWHNALTVAFKLLKVGGILSFGGPVNNWIDHGFYQFSPTLAFDFFLENEWEFLGSNATFYWQATGIRRSIPLYPKESTHFNFLRARVNHIVRLRKTSSSTCHRIPKQSIYSEIHDAKIRQTRFCASEPEDSVNGEVTTPRLSRFVLSEPKPADGAVRALFHDPDWPPSVPRRPFRSRALVYEDGQLLSWIVSDPAMVAERPGSFAHFGRFVHFTASDGSDPRENGKSYEVAFPSYPWLRQAEVGAPSR